jgi:hypothetical protein
MVLCVAAVGCAQAQEAASGFELRTNVTAAAMLSDELTQGPRYGAPTAAAGRAMLYPTWKLGGAWTVSGAVQVHTRPYFREQFMTQGSGIRADVLQAHLTYSRIGRDRSLAVRAGQLSSAFGSFLLRYDDMDNPLTTMPLTYGYNYKGVTNYGLAGAQIDVTFRKLDARAQFVNSSPANRRSIFDSDQYGNWAGGVGYTVVQGLRFGTSAYYGPYLHRQYRYFLPGEANPSRLRASAIGVDAQWTRGHWSSQGEWQHFNRPYRVMPAFVQEGGYAETRRVLHPRWYLAARAGYLRSSVGGTEKGYEAAVGFRPNSNQLLKVGYHTGKAGTLTVQFVTTLRLLSFARD